MLMVYPMPPSAEVGAAVKGEGETRRHGKVCVAVLEKARAGEEEVEAEETAEEDDEEGDAGGGDVCDEAAATGL